MTHMTRRYLYPSLLLATFALMLLTAGCQSDPESEPVDPITVASTSGPLAERLATEFAQHAQDAAGMSYDDLLTKYRRAYQPGIDFDVKQAAHYQGFASAFGLSNAALQTLATRGFVVVPAPASPGGGGPADLYYRVFAENLPVFISADSILHAWHRAFDKILETTEQQNLAPRLGVLLQKTMAALDDKTAAGRDALFYLSVARSLLDGSAPPTAVAADVTRFLDLIKSKRLERVSFMGEPTFIDFSQFIPRGHYERTEALKKYFKAMMWLGRTDLVLFSADAAEAARPREEAAARALAGAMQRAGAVVDFEHLDRFYRAFVGKTNALTPTTLLSLCAQAKLDACAGDAAAMQAIYAQQPPPAYSSRVFAGAVPPVSMRFFPQRFAYGAWVTSQTTTPRLEPAVVGGRAMAMPEDVAFALGADRAVETFAEEMKKPYREELPATLEAARATIAGLPPTALEDTIFNNWLEALIALGKTTLGPEQPQVMRTATWHDRKLEAMLASWAELRHDTILIVEQSTGGIGCQYPKGYVEPVPTLYAALDRAAARMAEVFASGDYGAASVGACMTHWRDSLGRLETIAEKQLAGQPTSQEDLDFLNKTADLHGSSYYGQRIFDGWYPQLFWTPAWRPANPDDPTAGYEMDGHPSAIAEPLVADVHTDAENGRALEVATGRPGLMIVAVDNQGDLSLYAGPVSSFYSFDVPLSERMTDSAWVARVEAGDLPPRPAFARDYWVDEAFVPSTPH